ncbi:type III pantothenate kinase [Algoriphagus boseongensis]|uniref:Type III pantothenate kinase n=1 Tax=Algoriphagus boseongensis TaxID=1442587 RepID=A0A4R6T4F8_9BACT|nr:type III pantothenate kinase [Algoriphagus boseongensis]TDQ17163.1 type III pantothenate kinase [Algoriphagus boseongensis]
MKNLVIDIGNTRIKSALFSGKELLGDHVFDSLENAVEFWLNMPFDHALVSSVRYSMEELQKSIPFEFQFLSHSTPLPIVNGYSTPHSLGLDRIAAAIGAWELAGKGPVLAIDLGSCVTYELVDELSVYRGGSISPGMAMRAKAMNTFTSKLPLVDLAQKPENFVGDSTITCMQAGIWYGLTYEMEGQIAAYRLKFPEILVFLCGGDAQSFVSMAKDHIFVVPNLVLHGLNCILNHNVE